MAHVVTLSCQGERLHLVYGKDRGIRAWYYLLVDKVKLPLFLKAAKSDTLELERYGQIVRRGWGYAPPDSVKSEMEARYGFAA